VKAKLNEYKHCFEISLEAETARDIAQLVRMGMNSTKELKSVATDVYSDATVVSYLIVGKRQRSDGRVPKRR